MPNAEQTMAWSTTFIAALLLSTLQSMALAFHEVSSSPAQKHQSSAALTSYVHNLHFSPTLHRYNVARSTTTCQLAASDDDNFDNGDFFGDDKGGNFFEEADKTPTPPTKEKDDDAPPMSLEELEMLATPFDEHLPKLNTVTLVGRVGNAPEPRYFDDGKVVLNLSLAVRRKYHPLERKVRDIRSGDEETDWFPLEFWGRDAEYVTNYVEKGARLGVTGSLVQDGWIDKMTGEQRRKAKIVVRHIDILESRAEAELRKSNKGDGYNGGGGGGSKYNDDDDEDSGPSPAGTGGFFS